MRPETMNALKDCLKKVQEHCRTKLTCNGCEIDRDCDLLYRLTGQIPNAWNLEQAAGELVDNVEDEDEL